MFKLAEAFKVRREQEFPDEYTDNLPSLCKHLHLMVTSGKYIFSADFLARGYRFDRAAAEKMWRIICNPEDCAFADIAMAIFTKNPDILNIEEADGIWESQPVTEIPTFPHTIDISKQRNQYPVPRQEPQDLPMHIPSNRPGPLSRNKSAEAPGIPTHLDNNNSVQSRLDGFTDRLSVLAAARSLRDFEQFSRSDNENDSDF
jgi:hypothetical protein